MKKKYLLILVLSGLFVTSFAQYNPAKDPALNEQQKEVMEVVTRLFDGMRQADSAKVHSSFRDNVTLYSSFTNKEGKPIMHEGSLNDFLVSIGTPHVVVYDEPIWDYSVHIDGNLANVWTKYAFYAGEKFSHCGVDAFMLNKDGNGWKIFHLTDTRKRQGCDIPENIKN